MSTVDADFPERDSRKTNTIPRNRDIEHWLIDTALSGLMTSGMSIGFADEVLARLDEHGPDVDTTRSAVEILEEVEEEALDMAAWLLLLAYERRTEPIGPDVHRVLTIVRAAADGYFAARRMRLDPRTGA